MKRVLFLLIAAVMLLSGCSSGAGAPRDGEYLQSSDAAASEKGYAADMNGWADMEPESPAAQPSEYPEESAGPNAEAGGEADALSQKLIHTGYMNIETLDFDESCRAVEELLKQQGGFVESSSVSGSTYYDEEGAPRLDDRYAEYRLRVPSGSFEAFLVGAGGLGNVTNRTTGVDNITTKFYDTEARLESYQVQYDRLLELMERAELMEDILAIENQLTQVRYEIESLTTLLRGWQNQVDYSTVNLTVREVKRYTPAARVPLGQRLADAFSGSLHGFADWLERAGVSLIYAAPYLLLLLAAFLIARKLGLRLKKPRLPHLKKKDNGGDGTLE